MDTMHQDETGITLVEVMVALIVLGITLTALFQVVTGSLQSLNDSRQRQDASQASTEIIEFLREAAPGQVAMLTDATNGAAFNLAAAEFTCTDTSGTVASAFDPDGDGPLGCEPLVGAAVGAVQNAPPFVVDDRLSIDTYVTTAPAATIGGTSGTATRVTVVAEYTIQDDTRQIRRSALFSEVGLG